MEESDKNRSRLETDTSPFFPTSSDENTLSNEKREYPDMRKLYLRMAAIFGFTAVILGAFGAHSLESYVSPEALDTFDTGVRYQFYHAVMIGIIGALTHFGRKKMLNYAVWLFSIGIVLFSGSIYLLSIKEIIDLGSWLGPITPIGGTLFIVGWGCLFASTFYNFDRSMRPG